jgi:hypothetical protein
VADSAGLIASPERIAKLHDTERVEIRVEKLPSPNAEYHDDENVILINRRIIGALRSRRCWA